MVTALMGAAAMADDFEDSVAAALDAYRAGDFKGAKEEIDFASQILSQMRAAQLEDFLPEPLDGWERRESSNSNAGAAMFGGGQMASAAYAMGDDYVEIQIMADNQMVATMATMFSNTAMMGAMGQVKRIGRQKVVITKDGDVQAMVDNRIMIQISGKADLEVKEAYFGAIDLKGLKDTL